MKLRVEEAIVDCGCKEHVTNVVKRIGAKNSIEKVDKGFLLFSKFVNDVGTCCTEGKKFHLSRGIDECEVGVGLLDIACKVVALIGN